MRLSKIEAIAQNLLNKHYIDDPSMHEIETLIMMEGGFVKTKKLNGAQARLLKGSSKSLITISDKITSTSKKRFILAHELGHMILHNDQTEDIHNDDLYSFIDWSGKRPEETEANHFAANILMPKKIFLQECGQGKFSCSKIKELSNRFRTGLISTSIRYSHIGKNPIAMIYSTNNIIKWASINENFPHFENPLKYIPFNVNVPNESVANYLFQGDDISGEEYEVDINNYFGEDKNIDKYLDWDFWESGFYLKNYNSVISYIYPK